jgi:hypothetical protein
MIYSTSVERAKRVSAGPAIVQLGRPNGPALADVAATRGSSAGTLFMLHERAAGSLSRTMSYGRSRADAGKRTVDLQIVAGHALGGE